MGGLLWNSAALSTESHQPPYGPAPAENTGSDELQMLAVFNNGTYESINLSAWMAGNPGLLLSTNFGVPESVFAKFPKDAVVIPEQK